MDFSQQSQMNAGCPGRAGSCSGRAPSTPVLSCSDHCHGDHRQSPPVCALRVPNTPSWAFLQPGVGKVIQPHTEMPLSTSGHEEAQGCPFLFSADSAALQLLTALGAPSISCSCPAWTWAVFPIPPDQNCSWIWCYSLPGHSHCKTKMQCGAERAEGSQTQVTVVVTDTAAAPIPCPVLSAYGNESMSLWLGKSHLKRTVWSNPISLLIWLNPVKAGT